MTGKEEADLMIDAWRKRKGITQKTPPTKLPLFPASRGGDEKNDTYWKECALLDETHLIKLIGRDAYVKWFAEIDGFQYLKGERMNFRKLSMLICEKIQAYNGSQDNFIALSFPIPDHAEPLQLPDPAPPEIWEEVGYLVDWGQEVYPDTIMI